MWKLLANLWCAYLSLKVKLSVIDASYFSLVSLKGLCQNLGFEKSCLSCTNLQMKIFRKWSSSLPVLICLIIFFEKPNSKICKQYTPILKISKYQKDFYTEVIFFEDQSIHNHRLHTCHV